jgi:hypothetical protein
MMKLTGVSFHDALCLLPSNSDNEGITFPETVNLSFG